MSVRVITRRRRYLLRSSKEVDSQFQDHCSQPNRIESGVGCGTGPPRPCGTHCQSGSDVCLPSSLKVYSLDLSSLSPIPYLFLLTTDTDFEYCTVPSVDRVVDSKVVSRPSRRTVETPLTTLTLHCAFIVSKEEEQHKRKDF